MFKVITSVALVCAVAAGAFAESRESRLAKAHQKLKESDPAAAIELLRELQVDSPKDERVLYALGCAQYKLAEMAGGVQGAAPGAGNAPDAFKDARDSFESLLSASDPEIAQHAMFDRANCIAQSAKLGANDPAKAQEAINALRNAGTAYDDYLRKYPDDKDAKQNLDHVRYLMKVLQLQHKDEQKQDQKQDQKNQDQPKATLAVRNAQTELPGAKAVIGEDNTIQLQRPAPQGAPQ